MTEEQYNSLKKGDRIYSISRGINSDGTLGDVRVSDIVYHFSHHGTDKCPSITGIGWYRFDVAYIDRSNCGHNGVYAFQKREMLQDGWVIEIDTKNPLTAGNRTSMENNNEIERHKILHDLGAKIEKDMSCESFKLTNISVSISCIRDADEKKWQEYLGYFQEERSRLDKIALILKRAEEIGKESVYTLVVTKTPCDAYFGLTKLELFAKDAMQGYVSQGYRNTVDCANDAVEQAKVLCYALAKAEMEVSNV